MLTLLAGGLRVRAWVALRRVSRRLNVLSEEASQHGFVGERRRAMKQRERRDLRWCWGLVALGLFASACARTPSQVSPASSPPAVPKTQAVEREAPASPTPPQAPAKPAPVEQQVHFPLQGSFALAGPPDAASPVSIVSFGLTLLERQEPGKAAAFFLEAADLEGAASRGNEFRIASVAAAAASYLQAGEIPAFQETAARLRQELNRFQAAAPEPRIALILAIDDRLRGVKGQAVPLLPWPVQELLRQ